MNTEEATQMLKDFASTFAGASYDDVCQYESQPVVREVTAASGTVYKLFLASTLFEVDDRKQPQGTWGCCLSVSATPVTGSTRSRKSIGGNKTVMPGDTWAGDLENVVISEPQSMLGCYVVVAVLGLLLFGVAYGIGSCARHL